jgi:pre-rRNA-processing protein TSR4
VQWYENWYQWRPIRSIKWLFYNFSRTTKWSIKFTFFNKFFFWKYASTSFQEEQNHKTKSPNINDNDFDLYALAEALEQAATLASNSKKQNKSKRTITLPKNVLCPRRKKVILEYRVRKISWELVSMNKKWLFNLIFWFNLISAVLPCFYAYYDKERCGSKGRMGSSSNGLVLAKEIVDTANDLKKKNGEKSMNTVKQLVLTEIS